MSNSQFPAWNACDPFETEAMDPSTTRLFPEIDMNELFPPEFSMEDYASQSNQSYTPIEPEVFQADISDCGEAFGSQQMQLALMQPAVPLAPFPAIAEGLRFHPEVGWYYPALFPSMGFQRQAPEHQGFFSDSMPMDFPTEQTTALQLYPSPTATVCQEELFPPANSANPQQKRKVSDAPSFVPRKARKTQKQGSIIQSCVCAPDPVNKIPRPKNAFILYRSFHAKQLLKQVGNNNQKLSVLVGKQWQDETDQVKDKFRALAETERARHRERYPDYTFQPGSGKAAKFGNERCVCGAFEINKNNVRQKRELATSAHGTKRVISRVPKEDDLSSNDEIVVNRHRGSPWTSDDADD